MIAISVIGLLVGFLSGMFGKGGSAIATPLLHLAGVPALVAVASPLPAVVPSTLLAAVPYWRAKHIDMRLVKLGAAFGVPATVLGAYLTHWINGTVLVVATDAVILALAIRLLFHRHGKPRESNDASTHLWRIGAVTTVIGLAGGLLANSGGFLLAPLFIVLLGIQTRRALGSSLVLSSILAIPGTIVHAQLGHINWAITLVFGVASVPLALVGANVALRTKSERIEWMYALLLIVVSVVSVAQLVQ
jgi:uncharacterized protein